MKIKYHIHCSQLPAYGCNATSYFLLPCLAHHDGPDPFKLEDKMNYSFLKLLPVEYGVTEVGKVSDTENNTLVFRKSQIHMVWWF